MKRFLALIFLLCVPVAGWSQSTTLQQGTITGTVADNNGAPLPSANVAVINSDGAVITGAITNQNGEFTIQVDPGQYVIKVTFISFQTYKKEIKVSAGDKADIGTIVLQPITQQLGQLVVRGEKSTMTMDFDKRTFNVGKDITSMGGSAVNVLRNVPSVSIGINGNISLRGNQSVRILINGHPSRFVGSGIQALRSIPSNMIKKVEIITNPSAKYSAAGTGGIINIVLVKNRRLGFNGSAAINTGYPQDHGISTNLNYQAGNFNWFMNGSLGYEKDPENGRSFQRFSGPDTTYMYRERTISNETEFSGNIRLGTDYYLTKKQTLTASVFISPEKEDQDETIHYTNLAYSPGAFDGNVLERQLRANSGVNHDFDTNFNLRYENRINGSQQKLTASIRFGLSREPSSTGIRQTVLNTNKPAVHQRTRSQENRNRFRVNIEYKQPLGNTGKLETGLRSSTRWSNNSQTVEELQNGEWQPFTRYNGNFLYRQNVNSAYIILGKKFGDFSGEVGLRAENTRIRTEVKSTNEVNTQNYLNLFPSVFLNYKFNRKSSIQVSYSRRLRRPWSRMLLPYSDYSNSRSQRVGNPKLSPEFSNSFEGGYLRTWNSGSLLTSFYYRHRTGVIERITKQNNGILIRYPINLATEDAWGVEFSVNQDLFEGLSFWGNMNFYKSDRNGTYKNQILSSKSRSFRARARLRWDFLDTWHFQGSLRYRGPHNTTQGRSAGNASIDVGLSHDLFNKSARISLGIRDLLDSQNFKNIQTTDGIPHTDFYSRRSYQWSARTFSLSFRYFFTSSSHNNPNRPSRHHY